MPPTNPRKRAAPGSPAQAPQMQQAYTAPNALSDADFLRWSQGPGNTSYAPDPSFNMNGYSGEVMPQQQYDPSLQIPSTQLARRPVNRQLVPTAQRAPYDNSGDPWGQFGDDSLLDPQNTGRMEENDNIELLEEKAAVAKREAQSKRKQIPPFVQKLSSFLDELKNTELIRWSDRGDSFVVLDEDEFAKTLIPELFKHNNYASFVRQLNMYGFHKRVGLSDNSMKASERKNKSPSEYYNPYFKRGHPNLLWLINKPKGGNTKTSANRGKKPKEEQDQEESEDEGRDGIEQNYGQNYGNNMPNSTRAISAAPESGPLQRREMVVVQKELADIQKNQAAISHAIARLRKDHNQLYQQAVAFQTLHDRHESSINAILTFLATVYNRSLDGQGPQNIAQMFANVIPQDQQQQGNVVDIGDLSNQQEQNPGSMSPHRRQQRLLMAPPKTGGRASTISPAATPQAYDTPQTGAIEELFENSPADSTQMKMEPELPQQDMMDIINNTNARSGTDTNGMEFPAMLSHYENANGNSPLTNQQRATMLNMIAQSTAPGSNNALVNPNPGPIPNLAGPTKYNDTELNNLEFLSKRVQDQLDTVQRRVGPLSPSGSIPGLGDNSYFDGTEVLDPSNSNLDLDQFLDTGAWANASSPLNGTSDFTYDGFPDTGMGESQFDLGMDHSNDAGRIVETANSSEVNTPKSEIEDIKQNGLRSPTKRRRKN